MSNLPEEWEKSRLGDVVDSSRPITYGIVQAGPHVEDGIPYIRVSDMTKGYLTTIDMLRTSPEIAYQYRRSAVKFPDLVFALRGNPGLVLKVPPELDGANLTQGTARIAASNHADPDYLLWAIRSPMVQEDIFKRLKGSTFREISLAELKKLVIPLPPLPEQQAIAEILGTWDEAIALVEALIRALEQRKQGLMQRLLTGEVRFPGFEEEWEERPINDLLKEAKRRVKIEADHLYKLVSIRRRSGGTFFRETRAGNELTETMYEVKEGDFLISKRQIVHGASALAARDVEGFIVSNAYHVFVGKNGNSARFFNWLSKTPYLYHLSYLASHGIHIEKLFFDLDTYLKFKIAVPTSLDEQEQIADTLDTVEAFICQLGEYYTELQTQKRGLMQKLLTGEIRVNV
jgi:type I restriction enzyme, S subunit